MSDMYRWRTSSYSGQGATCVEVADNVPGVAAVRDTKDRSGPVLRFTADDWRAFVRDLKASTRLAAARHRAG